MKAGCGQKGEELRASCKPVTHASGQLADPGGRADPSIIRMLCENKQTKKDATLRVISGLVNFLQLK